MAITIELSLPTKLEFTIPQDYHEYLLTERDHLLRKLVTLGLDLATDHQARINCTELRLNRILKRYVKNEEK